ncbi:META domain-containing protein [Actinomycetaceae bacterium MB13-C1-2]|nr:META domain-containing protein [Actinomycetaceae bacterium MB13-C1-2]
MKRIMTLGVVAVFGVSMLTGCGESGGGETATPENITGAWVLESATGPKGDVVIVEGTTPELTVEDEGAFHGTAGCNNLFGTVRAEGDKLLFGPVASTMMACDEPIMDAEYAYVSALDVVTSGTISGDSLVLKGDDAELKFKRG